MKDLSSKNEELLIKAFLKANEHLTWDKQTHNIHMLIMELSRNEKEA